jgi:hypothetical protein
MNPCPNCGKNVPFLEAFPPGRADSCDHCGAALRTCLACKNYDKSAYNECHEPAAERVVDKEKPNFCEWYKFGAQKTGNAASKDELLERARALFKK